MAFERLEKAKYTPGDELKDSLKIGKDVIQGTLSAFTGKSGDFYIAIVPSLKVIGYGETEIEAMKDLEYNLDLFGQDILSVDEMRRNEELRKLGFTRHKYFNKRFEGSYIDKDGVLQNFDNPEEVKVSQLVA